jgi:hypothetical protein
MYLARLRRPLASAILRPLTLLTCADQLMPAISFTTMLQRLDSMPGPPQKQLHLRSKDPGFSHDVAG